MPIKFEYNGVTYEMTDDQIEAAYRYQERQYRLADAKTQLFDFVYGCNPDMLSRIDKEICEAWFKEQHGITVSDALGMLDAFLLRYEIGFDCNCDENSTWQNAIRAVLDDHS